MRRSLSDIGGTRNSTLEQFFNDRCEPATKSGCWLWTGKVGPSGYGEIRRKRGDPNSKAHRVSYELHKGPIPEGMCVCHTCDVRLCVNPDHLWLGTNADNVADKMRKGRHRTGPQHGSHNPQAKLTEAQARAIKADPRVQTKIAADYGISQCAVSDIKVGRRWAFL